MPDLSVLRLAPALTDLSAERMSFPPASLTALQQCESLTRLHLSPWEEDESLEPAMLAQCTQLTHISLQCHKLPKSALLQLPWLAALRELDCGINQSRLDEATMRALSACRALTQLKLKIRGSNGAARFLQLLPSSPLPALYDLSLEAAAPKADLSPLAACPRLHTLCLGRTPLRLFTPELRRQLQLPSPVVPSLKQINVRL